MAEGTSGRSSDRFHLKWTLARKIGGLASLLVLLLLIVAVYNYYVRWGTWRARCLRSLTPICR